MALLAGCTLRVAYVLAQPASDPTFARPMLDGAYHLEQARRLFEGIPADGAYYLAPLYSWLLAGWLRGCGADFTLLYFAQHALVLAGGACLSLYAARRHGGIAGAATAVLFAFHHPLIFFASRPLGEALAIALLCAGLWIVGRDGTRYALAGGVLVGTAALARPNLLLVAVLWSAGELLARRPRSSAAIALGVALVVLPVTLRNAASSGHLVVVSANAGITAYHGNGPGAAGTYTRPAGFSGGLSEQRVEATRLAAFRAGRTMDAVEADRWWGRLAWETRRADPGGTLRLIAWRLLLLLDNVEHGLDDHPDLDANRFRPAVRGPDGPVDLVPFALLAGLAAGSLLLGGIRGSGGWRVWGAIVACAAMPVAFYVSSRYRLPLAALLTVPAACGLEQWRVQGLTPRSAAAALVGACVALGSVLVPSADLVRAETAAALSNRAAAHKIAGHRELAERDALAAVEIDPASTRAHYNLGVIRAASGRLAEAERSFRRALDLEPGFAEAATNLASLLIGRGRPLEAVPILHRALEARPFHPGCWINLVVARLDAGDVAGARDDVSRARRLGVALDPKLLREVEARTTAAPPVPHSAAIDAPVRR